MSSLSRPPIPPNLNVPPPPPPPFSLAGPPPPSIPILASGGFQQTSPGQKENWPEAGHGSEQPGGNRLTSTHSSVLKELTPAKAFEGGKSAGNPPSPPQTSPLIDPDAMEIVSEEEVEEDSPADMKNEGTAEFASKLKQKTANPGGMKSHVFVPNPERPNLVTLSVSEDLDEEDMIDDDTVMEGSSEWSSKSHKFKKSRSRSRSRSRSKERSHKHKKKKKHKRKDSEEEDYKGQEDDDRNGSVAKRLDSRSSSRNSRDSLKGDKYDDRGKYGDKYDDRKYEDRKYRGDQKGPYRDPRSRDVEAYTQAFIQQYSQARYGSYGHGPPPNPPRRPNYGKY